MSAAEDLRDAKHLLHLERERRAICKALQVVDDSTLDLAMVAVALRSKMDRQNDLLRRIADTLEGHHCSGDFEALFHAIGTEVSR